MAGLSPVPGDTFTDEMLAKNFVAIAGGFDSIDNRLDMFDNWIKHLEGHITELYTMAKVAAETKVKTPSRTKAFVVGAVVGVVAYRYIKNNRQKIEQLREQVVEKAADKVEQVVYGSETKKPETSTTS